MDFEDYFIPTFIVIFALALGLFLIDGIFSKASVQNGIVVSHQFSAGQTFVGNGVSSSGNVTVNVSSTSDEYVLIVKSGEEYVKVKTDISFFSTTKDSTHIEFYKHRGCITGWTWGYSR